MTPFRSAAVAGLGLIGGSLARDLAALGVRVLGHDRDPRTVEAALAEGVAHAALGPGLEGVEEADLLVLAVPVSAAASILTGALPRLGGLRLVTDVGSTKRSVCAAAGALGIGDRFVGSHPLAGSHESGWEASRPGLFRGARVFLTPVEGTRAPALALARELWTALGARPEPMGAAEHDRLLARTSHLPHAVACATALALADAGIPRAELGPGGQGVTRLAASSPGMWTAIALDNADFLAPAIGPLLDHLTGLRDALRRGDGAAVHAFFTAAHEWSREGNSFPERDLRTHQPSPPTKEAGMDRNQQNDGVTDRERPPEDGMQGVAEERGRMGGYGYDTPADMEQASDMEARDPEGADDASGS